MGRIQEGVKKLKTKKSMDSSSLEEDENGNGQSSITSSSDDEEANADLSLHIIKKARILACKNDSQVNGEDAIVRESKHDTYKKEKKEKKKRKKVDEDEVAELEVRMNCDSQVNCEAGIVRESKHNTDKKEKKKEKKKRNKVDKDEVVEVGVRMNCDSQVNCEAGIVRESEHNTDKKEKKEKKKRNKVDENEVVEVGVRMNCDFQVNCEAGIVMESEHNTDMKEKKKEKKKRNKVDGDEVAEVEVRMICDSQVSCEAGIVRESEHNTDKEKKKKKREKVDEDEVAEVEVDNLKDAISLQTDATIEISAGRPIGTDSAEVLDNAVMWKLLRGPRYFDPPDNSWGACYNCGEQGHTAINCPSARREKPCFVCGSFEHKAKQCSKGRDCFICNQQGHRAKDCPEKNQSSKICIKCGDSGHNLFACSNLYSADDLKDIQCYVCKNFGHLCCVNYDDPGPRELSCYRCGLSGHTGSACSGSRMDSNYSGSASLCFKCGEEGHFARECVSSIETTKRNRDFSTPRVKSFKKNTETENKQVKSAPHGIGKTSKTKRNQSEFTSPAQTDHSEFFERRFKQSNWSTPTTPKNRDYRFSISNSNSNTLRKHYNDSVEYYEQRYSDSQYGKSNNGWFGRNYNHW